MRRRIPHRNRSPSGWWIASYIERYEYHDELKRNPNRRCLAWENTILLKAPDREAAYRKALATGRLCEGTESRDERTGRRGTWRFEGLTSLLPIYDDIEDGVEVLWTVHRGRSVKTIRAMVRRKQDLETFQDEPPDPMP